MWPFFNSNLKAETLAYIKQFVERKIMMDNMSFMHQNEMDMKLRKFNDAIDYKFGKYLKGRVHVEKELWIIASIKNLIDYGYLKIEE